MMDGKLKGSVASLVMDGQQQQLYPCRPFESSLAYKEGQVQQFILTWAVCLCVSEQPGAVANACHGQLRFHKVAQV